MRFSVLVLSLLLSSVALAQQYGGVLRAGFQTDPVGLDPHITNATSAAPTGRSVGTKPARRFSADQRF